MAFLNRRDAGRQLAAQLESLASQRPVVVALPRGGVPVALEIARVLGAPLDVLAVRKLGAPGNPELGVGAIAEDGIAVFDTYTARGVGMTQDVLDATVRREVAELQRRLARYRDGRRPMDVRERTAIVVDDGLATGLTGLAAVRALRDRGAGRIVVAVPVGSRQAVALVGEEADEVVCHTIPRELLGVGRFYKDFSPVCDAEVVARRLEEVTRWAIAEPETKGLPVGYFGASTGAGDARIVLLGGAYATGTWPIPWTS